MAISDKLNFLIETKSQLKDMINYGLPTENQITNETTFRNYVKGIFEAFIESLRDSTTLYTNLPKISGNGTQITLNDTANAPMRITLKASELSQDATPTPDSPQDIHTISGDNNVVVEGKNKFTTDYKTTDNLTTYTRLSDNSYSFTNEEAQWKGVTFVVPCTPNTDYYFNYDYSMTGSSLTYCSIRGGQTNEALMTLYDGYFTSFNSGENTSLKINISNGTRSHVTSGTIYNIQLEKGTSATTFKAYQGKQEAQLNLPVENLLDMSTLVNGFVQQNGTFNQAHTNEEMRSNFIKVKPNTQYTFKIFESSWSSFNTYNWFGIGEYTTNAISGAIKRDTMTYVTQDYITITTTATTQYIVVSARGLASATKVQVNEGDLTSYTPYGTTPIEYCKIGNYEDEFILTSGKNFLNITNYITDTDGRIGLDISKLVIGDKYTFSSDLPITTFKISNKSTGYASVLSENNNGFTNYTFTMARNESTPSSATLYLYLKINDVWVTNISQLNNYNMQINEGTTALPYEPYGTNQWYLKKNIGKIVLDGSEDWTNHNTQNDIKSFRISLNNFVVENVLSNKYQYQVWSSFNSSARQLYRLSLLIGSSYYLYASQPDSDTNTLELFKTWLASNNVTIYYVLSTPTYTQITGELENQLNNIYEKLLSYKGTTNISQVNNDLPFIINASAIQDLE